MRLGRIDTSPSVQFSSDIVQYREQNPGIHALRHEFWIEIHRSRRLHFRVPPHSRKSQWKPVCLLRICAPAIVSECSDMETRDTEIAGAVGQTPTLTTPVSTPSRSHRSSGTIPINVPYRRYPNVIRSKIPLLPRKLRISTRVQRVII
jgi:hypothetical protein